MNFYGKDKISIKNIIKRILSKPLIYNSRTIVSILADPNSDYFYIHSYKNVD